MSHHARRVVTPSRKRKEMDRHGPLLPQTPLSVNVNNYVTKPEAREGNAEAQACSTSSNRLLAGYMAYEFLTTGTLFGERFDPAAVVPLRSKSEKPKANSASYVEVASLLKTGNAQVPGVVNPTQLARWLQM